MRALRIEASLDLSLTTGGAVFLAANGHGKTNLLELLSYPVLFSVPQGARDPTSCSTVGPGSPWLWRWGGADGGWGRGRSW